MSASKQPEQGSGRGPEDDRDRRHGERPSAGAQEVPLFLRDRSDGRKGDAQDEKDEVGE